MTTVEDIFIKEEEDDGFELDIQGFDNELQNNDNLDVLPG